MRLGAPGAAVQAKGFRPERLARISGKHWTMENVQAHFKDWRDNLYARFRLAKAPEEKQRVIRDIQKFNMDARKYRGSFFLLPYPRYTKQHYRSRKGPLFHMGIYSQALKLIREYE